MERNLAKNGNLKCVYLAPILLVNGQFILWQNLCEPFLEIKLYIETQSQLCRTIHERFIVAK